MQNQILLLVLKSVESCDNSIDYLTHLFNKFNFVSSNKRHVLFIYCLLFKRD